MADESNSNEHHTKKKKKSKKNKESHEKQDTTEGEGNDSTVDVNLKRKSSDSSQDEAPIKKNKVELPNGHLEAKTPKRNNWTSEQEKELLDRVQEHVSQLVCERGPKKHVFLKQIDFEKIKVGGFEPAEISAKFHLLSNRVRKMRTAMEIIADMKQLPESRGSKKQQKESDPLLPKKPLSAYFQYFREKREKVHQRHPELSNLELTSKIGKKWNKLSEEKKRKYSDRYQAEHEEYQAKMLEYLIEHNPSVIPPKDAFALWAEEEIKEVIKEFPDVSEKKKKKKLKRRWKAVSDQDKDKWEKRAKLEMKKYRGRVYTAQKKAKQSNSE